MTGNRDAEPARLTARLVLLAPVLFAVHWLEEAPGFVAWFNAHVDRGINTGLFTQVNLGALLVTIVVTGGHRAARNELSLVGAIAWFSLLMGANAVLHLAAAVVDRSYVPGLFSAALLYLPFFMVFFAAAWRERRVPALVLVVAAVTGAVPMLVHGYLILFERSRLF